MIAIFKLPERIGWRDHVVGVLLAAAYVTALLLTADTLGFARDEGFYFRAATQYARWFDLLVDRPREAFDRSVIESMWSYNHEHPSLMKSLFSVSWMLLHRKWHLVEASTAFRLPGMLMGGLALWVTYLFGARAYGRPAGLIAAMLLALMPRLFYHAHLAAFDMGIVAMWTLCIYVYYRSLERGTLGWALLLGLVYGLTLETKHNAWILPGLLIAHAAVVYVRSVVMRTRTRGLLPLPLNLILMLILGPLVFYALWPWMWHDTWSRWKWYYDFHMDHVYYNMEFLGRNYFNAPSPFAYMPLMIVATVPSITLLLFFVGASERFVRGTRGFLEVARALARRAVEPAPRAAPIRDRLHTDMLIGASLCAAIAPWVLPWTPIFGGTKHWMPGYPFLAMLAGHGFMHLLQLATELWPKLHGGRLLALQLGFGALVVAPPLAITIHSHPFGLTSYVPVVGGAAGAADLGLNRQFWGYTTQNANDEYLEEQAPKGATVFIHDTAWDSWGRMIEEGRVRRDLRGTGAPGDAQLSLVHYELHMKEVEYQIWTAYQTLSPVYVVTHDEVPVVGIYKRP